MLKVSPEGIVIREIPLVSKRPANIPLDGKDGCRTYVTLQDQGNLESLRVDIQGREWKMQRRIKHQ
jgi:hypothetical protein